MALVLLRAVLVVSALGSTVAAAEGLESAANAVSADDAEASSTPGEVPPEPTPDDALRALRAQLDQLEATLSATTATGAADLGALDQVETATEAEDAPPPVVEVRVPGARRVRLISTAENGGIGAERFVFSAYAALERTLGARTVVEASVHHGVVAQGPHLLVARDRRASTIVAFLDGTPIACDAPTPVTALAAMGERLFPLERGTAHDALWPRHVAAARRQRTLDAELRVCRSASATDVYWLGPSGSSQAELDWTLTRFEWRRGLRVVLEHEGRTLAVEDVPFPKNLASRRFRMLDLARHGPGARLFVDGGSFVDGSSRWSSTRVSSLRPLAFEMLSRLEPAALVPGASELAFGPTQLLREAAAAGLGYVATNWRAREAALELPPSRVVTIDTEEGPARVAFLGVVDPEVAARNPLLAAEGVELEDPVRAIERVAEQLTTSSVAVDAVVVLTSATRELVERLRREVTGVDVILAGGVAGDERLEQTALRFAPSDGGARAPVLVPLAGVVEAELELAPLAAPGGAPRSQPGVVGVETTYARTRTSVTPDPRVVELLAKTRAELFPRYDHVLVSGWTGAPLRAANDDTWRQVVCEALRRGTGADVVLLPELPHVDPVPGPLTELVVAERLAVTDRLALDEVGGDALRGVLASPPTVVGVACGAELGADPKVGGRALNPTRTYTLATTDRALQLGLGDVLAAAHRGRVFDASGPRPLLRDGQPAALRDVVLATLRAARGDEDDPPIAIEALLERSALAKRPAWFLLVDGLSFRVERFAGADATVFATVPDQLARAPSSLALGVAGDGRLWYDADALQLELRTRLRYQRLAVGDAEPRETDDNLRFALAASAPSFDFTTGPASWMPFVEGLVDTEFTPGSGTADAAALPRRLELSGTGGLSLKQGPLARLRVGAQVLRDYSRPDRPTKFGAKLDGEVAASPGPLKLSLRFESSAYLPVAGEDATDLRFRALLEGKLTITLARLVGFTVNGQALAFTGAVPATEALGLALRIGVALELAGAFKL
jgi:hypothetical protein